MSTPRFSVVIPVYNSTGTLPATARSVLIQTQADLELLLVDDGSGEATQELLTAIAAGDDRVRVIRQENAGTAAARNRGIAEARGEFICLLDDDDLWLDDYLEEMHAVLGPIERAGFAHADAWLLDDRFNRIRTKTSFDHYPPLPDVIEAGPLVERLTEINFVMSSVMCRAAPLRDLGGFDTEIHGTDDWDLWLRFALAGWACVHSRHPVLLQRDRPGSQSKNLGWMLENSLAVLERVRDDPRAPAAAQGVAAARIAAEAQRLEQIRSNAPIERVRRVRRNLIAARDRWRPGGDWLDSAPAAAITALPELGRNYGRASSSESNRSSS